MEKQLSLIFQYHSFNPLSSQNTRSTIQVLLSEIGAIDLP